MRRICQTESGSDHSIADCGLAKQFVFNPQSTIRNRYAPSLPLRVLMLGITIE
ncbi:MAG: hypothetical protein M3430_01225 [Acidobacteriota bacterium]|nr:hypothetical protein [Acidobacteriota bacterium]